MAESRRIWVTVFVLLGAIFALMTLFWAAWSLSKAATTDSLTGLLNRTRIWELLLGRTVGPKGGMAAMLSVDLDRFRSVNQIFGPSVGDQILIEVGNRLTPLAGKYRVGRLGSDDFAIYCAGISAIEAEHLGDATTLALGLPFVAVGHSFHLTASVGIAHTDASGPTNLRQGADDALNVAKRQGGNCAVSFVQAMHDDRKALAELEQQLHLAIDSEKELFIYYQPVVRLADEKLVAIEALARWTHPLLGAIPPYRFIELAETCGLILTLGKKLMAIAIRQAAVWHRGFPGKCPILNINISPLQFATGDVISDLVALVNLHGLAPADICIEVTEGTFADIQTVRALKYAKSLGFKIAMDDFGVGYSSLAQLPRLPLAAVKLDRSFVLQAAESFGDEAILRAIVHLAHSLQLEVIAEGVETPEQLALVTHCGCDAVQGYIFSRPLSAFDMDLWLSAPCNDEMAQSSGGSLELRLPEL